MSVRPIRLCVTLTQSAETPLVRFYVPVMMASLEMAGRAKVYKKSGLEARRVIDPVHISTTTRTETCVQLELLLLTCPCGSSSFTVVLLEDKIKPSINL